MVVVTVFLPLTTFVVFFVTAFVAGVFVHSYWNADPSGGSAAFAPSTTFGHAVADSRPRRAPPFTSSTTMPRFAPG